MERAFRETQKTQAEQAQGQLRGVVSDFQTQLALQSGREEQLRTQLLLEEQKQAKMEQQVKWLRHQVVVLTETLPRLQAQLNSLPQLQQQNRVVQGFVSPRFNTHKLKREGEWGTPPRWCP